MAYYLADITSTVSVGWDFFDEPVTSAGSRMDYACPESVSVGAQRARFRNARDYGYPLNPDTMPKRIRWMTARKETPDILPWFVVSERFRRFVEDFEPGVHQFIPVQVWRDKEGERVEPYYWFVVCRRLDSVNRVQTSWVWQTSIHDPSDGFWTDSIHNRNDHSWTKIPDARLVFDTLRIGLHHIWCDPHLLTGGNRLCSNAFGEAAAKEEFVGLTISPREEA